MLFNELCKYFEKIEKTSEKLIEVKILSELYSKLEPEEAKYVSYFLIGRICSRWENLEINIGEKTVIDVLSKISGKSKEEIEKLYQKYGDLGEVASKIKKKTISLFGLKQLTIKEVYLTLKKIAETEGENSQFLKKQYLEGLLMSCSDIERKYIVRIITNTLRLGVGEQLIIESLALMIGDRSKKEEIEQKFNYCSDIGLISYILKKDGIKGLDKIRITPGIPIMPALAQRAQSPREIIDRLKVCLAEGKYDGFRCQIHKFDNKVTIYSRNLENLTHMLPEIVEEVKKINCKNIIFEGEAISYDESSEQFLPFQETIQRRRKYNVEEMAKKYPLTLFAFDILYLNDEELVNKPLKERRQILENIINSLDSNILKISEAKIIDNEQDLEEFFEICIEKGLEGIIAKDLDSRYVAGARKWSWIKLKKSYEGKLSDSIDVVIVGYYYGKGARKSWGIGALLCAIYDKKENLFKTVAKVGSGMTEDDAKFYKALLDKIKLNHKDPRVISELEPDVWVEPKYVISVIADEITKSPIHTSGYALRFPRIEKRLREDKSPENATTLEEIIEMYRHIR